MKKFLLIGVIIMAVVVLSGCQTATEKVAEKAIESSTGVDADVDNNSITINTNDSSLTIGNTATIPDDFPSDVYVIDGDVISTMTINEDKTYQVQIDAPSSLSEPGDIYNEQLKAAGWDITSTLDMGDAISIMAEKDDRFTTVALNTSEDVTVVVIVTSIVSE